MIAWNEYLFALTLTKTVEMRTVPIGISFWWASTRTSGTK
jgi:ABC-type glycerol-3-phosphate transport system permease component